MYRIDEEAGLRDNMEIGDSGIFTDGEASKYDEKPKDIIGPQGNYHQMWHDIFLICCVVAVMLDPLFFYIPVLNEEKKCIKMDEKLKKITLVLRSLMDVTYIVNIVYQLFDIVVETSEDSNRRVDDESSQENKLWTKWWYILIDILSVLPIPQVVILVLFAKMNVSRSLDNIEIVNVFILSQYVPRIYRIYLSCKEYTTKLGPYGVTGNAWAKGLFNFFLYIIASHVTGAFWYFLAIQRETSCWQRACEKRGGCNSITLSCDDVNMNPILGSFLNDDCPIKPTNATLFDFGIFSSVLQSGISDSPGFASKFLYSFGWGLRNLSSFGSNLQTSSYIWENLFADSITITGLLLFIYLIGNLQTYLQFSAIRSTQRDDMMRAKGDDIHSWIRNNQVLSMKKDIMYYARLNLNENKEVNLKNILDILPSKNKRQMKHFLCLDILKKVPVLRNLGDKILQEVVTSSLEAVIFEEQSDIVQEGKPIDRMLFFTQGTVLTHVSYTDNSASAPSPRAPTFRKGDLYGKELLDSVIKYKSLSNLPNSSMSLKAHTKVEAFALKATELLKLVNKYKKHFNPDYSTMGKGNAAGPSKLPTHFGFTPKRRP